MGEPTLGVSPSQVIEPNIEESLVWWSPGLGVSPSVGGALVWVVSYLRGTRCKESSCIQNIYMGSPNLPAPFKPMAFIQK